MASCDKSGASQEEHLKAAAYGFMPDPDALEKLANAPELPELTSDVWDLYQMFAKRRSYGEHGPKRFTWPDIHACLAVLNVPVSDWALNLVSDIEDLYIKEYWENWRRNNPKTS